MKHLHYFLFSVPTVALSMELSKPNEIKKIEIWNYTYPYHEQSEHREKTWCKIDSIYPFLLEFFSKKSFHNLVATYAEANLPLVLAGITTRSKLTGDDVIHYYDAYRLMYQLYGLTVPNDSSNRYYNEKVIYCNPENSSLILDRIYFYEITPDQVNKNSTIVANCIGSDLSFHTHMERKFISLFFIANRPDEIIKKKCIFTNRAFKQRARAEMHLGLAYFKSGYGKSPQRNLDKAEHYLTRAYYQRWSKSAQHNARIQLSRLYQERINQDDKVDEYRTKLATLTFEQESTTTRKQKIC